MKIHDLSFDPLVAAAELRQLAEKALAAAEALERLGLSIPSDEYVPPAVSHRALVAAANAMPPQRRLTNVEIVTEYLRKHGPSSRSEMMKATGIPKGSFGKVLGLPQFKQVSHGQWGLAEPERTIQQ